MKQVIQNQRSGDVKICDTPAPALRPGGVLVRTAYSLISAGTERAKVELAKASLVGKARARPEQVRQVMRALREQGFRNTYRRVSNRLATLEPLGYSCSGRVTEVGNEVRDIRVGDFVACAGGGYANHAEVNFVPMNLCAVVPPGSVGEPSTMLESAAFTTVACIAMQGVRRADLQIGEVVAVIGLGLIGLIAVQILKASGCVVLGMDPDEARRRIALQTGCTGVAASASDLQDLTIQHSNGYGADAVLVAAASASNSPIETAARVARDRGRVVIVGAVRMDVPRQPFYDKELDLRLSRSYGPGRYDPAYEEHGRDYPIGYVRWTEKRNMEAFLELQMNARVDVRPLISHRFPIAEAARAYELISSKTEPYLGVIIDYGSVTATPEAEPPRPRAIELSLGAEREHRPIVPTPRELVRIGLIGAGSFAQNVLLPAFKNHRGIELRTVVTSSGLAAASAAKRFGFAAAASDPAAVLHDQNIDAVVIATRHDSHAQLAAEALRSGKAVFVEKPLAIDDAGLDEVIAARAEAADRSDVVVGFNRRFAPATLRVREWFDSVGEPRALLCRVNAGLLPRTHWIHDRAIGGGRLIGEGCHFLDLAGFLVGAKPVEVETTVLPDGGRYQQDNFIVRIRYANGSLATVTYLSNGASGAGKEYLEMSGGGRTAIIDDFRRVILASDKETRRRGGRFALDKGHSAEIDAFLQAIRRGAVSPIPFEDLVTSTRLTLRAMESLLTGRTVALS